MRGHFDAVRPILAAVLALLACAAALQAQSRSRAFLDGVSLTLVSGHLHAGFLQLPDAAMIGAGRARGSGGRRHT